MVSWQEGEQNFHALWHSEAGIKPPSDILVVDETLNADRAYQLASQGQALLWRGDFHQAKQLLQALARRCDKSNKAVKKSAITPDSFHLYRMAQAQRARLLGRLLIPLQADGKIPLGRAPDCSQAITQVLAPCDELRLISLRELLSLIGAYEWRKNGVLITALQAKIHPHYGVFSPIRGEYLNLLAQAPLPSCHTAWDIGTGTGVISAILAKRGIAEIIATDSDPRAIACAKENLARLGAKQVQLQMCDLFPEGTADLIVCNPPWLPAKPSAPIEYAIYDPDSRMLRRFLAGVKQHLNPAGEVWLVMSNLAELLYLRGEQDLAQWIAEAGLKVVDRMDSKPQHGKAFQSDDALYAARVKEVTSLWRLVPI